MPSAKLLTGEKEQTIKFNQYGIGFSFGWKRIAIGFLSGYVHFLWITKRKEGNCLCEWILNIGQFVFSYVKDCDECERFDCGAAGGKCKCVKNK